MIRATLIHQDASEGLYAFFSSIDEARAWVAYYLDHPVFGGYAYVIEVTE